MVGVPGRSKACSTCKKRRLGCDQLRPSCRQCSRSGLKCGGYDRKIVFVNSSQNANGAGAGWGSFAPTSYSTAIRQKLGLDEIGPSTAVTTATSSPLLDSSLEGTAATSKFLFLYWNFLLPNNGQQFTPHSVNYSTTGWMDIVHDLGQRDDGVRLGLLFNALALVGQRTGQVSVIKEAWQIYSKALKTLGRSLTQVGELGDAQASDDQLLMTAALFAAFELLQVSEGRQSWLHGMTWLRHSYGQKAIILARGPERYVDGNAHRLFRDARLHLLYPDIHNRKRSPFCSEEWKSIPWSIWPKSPRDDLVDILVEIPKLLEDLDNCVGSSPCLRWHKVSAQEELRIRCQLYDAQLQNWSAHSGATVLAATERQSSLETEPQSNCGPISDDFAVAHLGLIYYSTCTLLYEVLQELSGGILDARTDPLIYCRKILDTVLFFLRPEMGAIFINLVAFPVGVVVSSLARRKENTNWLSEEVSKLLQQIFRSQHGGARLRAFLQSWPWQCTAESQLVMGTRKPRNGEANRK